MAIGIQDQYFGTEIEMTGITRQRAAEVVAEMFGTRAVCDGGYYGVWSVTDQEGKKWKFMYDGSIYTERRERGRMVRAGSEYSTEMVSPKLSYGEMGKLQEVVRCLRHHGAKVNESCGKLTKQMLQGIRVASKEELSERIYKYFDEINQIPIPYHGSYNLDSIDLATEDIDQIVYEVVNAKAASEELSCKRAPKPIKRSPKKSAKTEN